MPWWLKMSLAIVLWAIATGGWGIWIFGWPDGHIIF